MGHLLKMQLLQAAVHSSLCERMGVASSRARFFEGLDLCMPLLLQSNRRGLWSKLPAAGPAAEQCTHELGCTQMQQVASGAGNGS